MKTFKIRVVSGGIHRSTHYYRDTEKSLREVVEEFSCGKGVIVEERPGWAFAHVSQTASAEITWS